MGDPRGPSMSRSPAPACRAAACPRFDRPDRRRTMSRPAMARSGASEDQQRSCPEVVSLRVAFGDRPQHLHGVPERNRREPLGVHAMALDSLAQVGSSASRSENAPFASSLVAVTDMGKPPNRPARERGFLRAHPPGAWSLGWTAIVGHSPSRSSPWSPNPLRGVGRIPSRTPRRRTTRTRSAELPPGCARTRGSVSIRTGREAIPLLNRSNLPQSGQPS